MAVARLDHDELAGRGGRGDFGRGEREHVVVGRQPPVGDHARGDINGHHGEYSNRSWV